MAATSASRSWAAFARRAVTAGAVAGIGLVALAIPASAHTPSAKAGCDKETSKPTVSVKLLQYQLEQGKPDGKPNSVAVVEVVKGVDSAPLVEQAFGAELKKTFVFDKLDGRVEHTFKVVIKAFDDMDATHPKGWSTTIKDLKSEVCDTSTPEQPPVPPVQPPVNPAPPVVTTTTTPAVVGANASLASTGVSIAVPIAVGGLLLVGGGVLLLMMRKRGKA